MIELKPCPFCGGEAIMRQVAKPDTGELVIVECAACKARSRLCSGLFAKTRAAERWNRRTYQPDEIEAEFMKLCEAQMEKES